MNRIKKYLKELFPGSVLLFTVAHFMHHVPGFIIQGIQTSLISQFSLTHYQVGLVSRSYNLAYGAGNLPAGWLGGRIAPRLLITIGVVGVAAFAFVTGFSPTYTFLLVAMLFVGLLGGGYHACASPVVSDTVDQEKRGKALGVHQIGGTAANMIVPVAAAAIATALTWRWSYFILTVPIVIFGVVLYVMMTRRHLGDSPKLAAMPAAETGPAERVRLRPLIAFMIAGTSVQIFVYSALYFVQSLVVEQFHGPQLLGGVMFALSQFGGLFAGPLGGHISDRIGRVPVMVAVSLVAGPLVFALGIVNTWWLLPFALLAVGACQYVAMPVTEAYVIGSTSTRNRSAILGIYYFASRGGPGLLTPIIGNLIDTQGYGRAFGATGAVLLGIAIVCSLLFWGTKDQPIHRRTSPVH